MTQGLLQVGQNKRIFERFHLNNIVLINGRLVAPDRASPYDRTNAPVTAATHSLRFGVAVGSAESAPTDERRLGPVGLSAHVGVSASHGRRGPSADRRRERQPCRFVAHNNAYLLRSNACRCVGSAAPTRPDRRAAAGDAAALQCE